MVSCVLLPLTRNLCSFSTSLSWSSFGRCLVPVAAGMSYMWPMRSMMNVATASTNMKAMIRVMMAVRAPVWVVQGRRIRITAGLGSNGVLTNPITPSVIVPLRSEKQQQHLRSRTMAEIMRVGMEAIKKGYLENHTHPSITVCHNSRTSAIPDPITSVPYPSPDADILSVILRRRFSHIMLEKHNSLGDNRQPAAVVSGQHIKDSCSRGHKSRCERRTFGKPFRVPSN